MNFGSAKRGISSRNENHPLPERPEDALPLQYLESVKEALSSYVTTTSASSGMSSPTTQEDSNNFLVMSHNSHGWTTGNSTERSSLFSWADDEFDKQASKTVKKMFDEIDDMLFEEHKNATTSLQVQNECKEWNGRFPHLRILGHQMIAPRDEGYQYYPSARPPTAGELLDVGDHEVPDNASPVTQGLTISGKHLQCLKAPMSGDHQSISSKTDSMPDPALAYLEEEVFESDGYIEEYFAYDHYQDDEEHERKKFHAPRRRPGFPPVTPNACLQNTVLSQTFDVLWAEVVVWMRAITRKHCDFISEENQFAAQDDTESQMSSLRPVTQTYDLGFDPTPYGQHTGRLMELHAGKLASMTSSLKLNSTAPVNFNFGIQPEQQQQRGGALNSVMTISSKALHNKPSARAPSVLGDETFVFGGVGSTNRPGSSNLMARSNRPMSVRTSDNFSYNYRQPSARGAKGRLKPLDGRSKTPQLEGMITGKKIVTATERLGSPPHPTASSPSNNYHWSRNNTLPPIEISQQENSNQFPMRPMKSQNKFRISSAVMDDRGLRGRDKGGLNSFIPDSRPSTTHAFRDESTIFGGINGRRSSTPHAFSALKPPGSATGNRGNVPRITGVSLGIPGSQSHIETSSVGPYGGPQPNYFRVL